MRAWGALTGGLLAVVLTAGLIGSTAQAAAHQDVWLKNELGERITPGKNGSDPYSPKKTCGTCHGYATITKGYHFQQGFDVMSDRFDAQQPWLLSPGMYGRWQPYAAAGRLAAKKNADPRQIDLSAYDWIGGGKLNPAKKIQSPACGWCHPGGGPLEHGRTPEGRADLTRTLSEAEGKSGAVLDGDFSSRFTPDGRSRFRLSGVVEADCLICHLPGYRMEARNEQLSVRNYRWAATAGAGLGQIRGAVFTFAAPEAGPDDPRFLAGSWNLSTRPSVAYRWTDRRLFTPEGSLRGALVSRGVGAANCLQCHAQADAKNTGTINAAPYDVHAKAGLQCTDCHPLAGNSPEERLQHQIAKGHSPATTVRDDLDGAGMKTCIGCHKEGLYRPPRTGTPPRAPDPEPTHEERFPKVAFHTAIVTCNGCHVTAQPARGLALLDLGTGVERGFTADGYLTAGRAGDYRAPSPSPWRPWLTRAQGGPGYAEAYLPHLPKRIQWFGERFAGGVRPIPLHFVQEAFRGLRGVSVIEAPGTDGARVRIPLVLTDAEILGMIDALTRKGFREVVLVSDRLYARTQGGLGAGPETVPADSYPIAHGVGASAQGGVLGAKGSPGGCLDCHGASSPFFTKVQVMNIREFLRGYPELKPPQALPQMNGWGIMQVPPAW
jgi:hypothetical protein